MNLRTLSLAEAHAETGISVRMLRKLIDTGKLKGNRVGRHYRVSVASLEQFVCPPDAQASPLAPNSERHFGDIVSEDRFA